MWCSCRELEPVQPAALGAAVLAAFDTVALSISPDEQLLAVCQETCVDVYALHDLVLGGTEALATWRLPSGQALGQVCSNPIHLVWLILINK